MITKILWIIIIAAIIILSFECIVQSVPLHGRSGVRRGALRQTPARFCHDVVQWRKEKSDDAKPGECAESLQIFFASCLVFELGSHASAEDDAVDDGGDGESCQHESEEGGVPFLAELDGDEDVGDDVGEGERDLEEVEEKSCDGEEDGRHVEILFIFQIFFKKV